MGKEAHRAGSDAAENNAVVGVRRTTLAARLKAIYGSVDKLDAFVGMVSERHVAGTEFGALQLAMWKKQFEAVRDGDRFFYQNDPRLRRSPRDSAWTFGKRLPRSSVSTRTPPCPATPSSHLPSRHARR